MIVSPLTCYLQSIVEIWYKLHKYGYAIPCFFTKNFKMQGLSAFRKKPNVFKGSQICTLLQHLEVYQSNVQTETKKGPKTMAMQMKQHLFKLVFYLCMGHHVSFQSACVNKALFTNCANAGFFPGMSPHMHVQSTLVPTAFVTNCTSKR